MRKPLVRILIWLGIMAALTLLAMLIWTLATGGSQSTSSLKWLQFLQTLGTFLLPPMIGAWLWAEHKPLHWLRLNRAFSWQTALLAIAIMLCAIPAINLLADLNSRVVLPKSLDFIEQILRQQEDAAAQLTERFLQADNIGTLLINICLMALLPALAEELSFRGTLQQILNYKTSDSNAHIAIWTTAFIFSAIHMQFYGFIPRMLMGAMFGYIFIWTGSLWVPVLMHFTNNGIAVLAYYIFGETGENHTWADTIGSGSSWWLGVLSIIVTIVLLWIIYTINKQKTQTV